MSLSAVQTKAAAAASYLAAGDYDSALTSALAAQALLIGVPDSEKNGEAIRYRDRQIDALIGRIEKARNRSLAASSGVQRTKLTRARVSSS